MVVYFCDIKLLYSLEIDPFSVALLANIFSPSEGHLFTLFIVSFAVPRASLVAQMVKNLPAMQETWVQSLGWEDPFEEGMATHSSFLAWRIPTDRGAWRATVQGVTKSRTQPSG